VPAVPAVPAMRPTTTVTAASTANSSCESPLRTLLASLRFGIHCSTVEDNRNADRVLVGEHE